ncbi:interleukin-5 receptor subunit alpha [Bufo bufo]|uniref:interleukin-5 receptor subunit alpha n=1 Tax=Bufo bufo TaxID=8384 RepID=UPI001ABED994|nr:interleukin-5 receptor subunit alpha [Bufo bufo]
MPGAASLLLLLSCCQVFAYDVIEPPQEVNIAVPILGSITLTWKHSVAPQNKKVKYVVKVITPEKTEEIKTSKNYSTRYMLALHGGLTAQVAALTFDSQDYTLPNMNEIMKKTSVVLPPYPGAEGTSATDLSCQILIDSSGKCPLSCKWAPGAKAPADTEYNLYYRCDTEIERCLDYTTEPGGQRRVGCWTLSKYISTSSDKPFLVLINGTSKSLKIRAMEKIFTSGEIETIPPVQKLTLNKTGLHWKNPVPSLPETCFQYEVNIGSKGRNETFTVADSSYSIDFLQKPSTRHVIRVRAVGKEPCWFRNNVHSPWTDLLDSREDVDSSDTLGIILSVCLGVSVILTLLLCIRFWGRLFPQIPKPNNDLKDIFQNVQNQALMRCNSWDNEEVISYIEEIVESDKYKTSSDYGHIGDYSSSGLCKPLK